MEQRSVPGTERVQVGFRIRAHAWVAGSIPGHGRGKRQTNPCFSHIGISLPVYLSLNINEHVMNGVDGPLS